MQFQATGGAGQHEDGGQRRYLHLDGQTQLLLCDAPVKGTLQATLREMEEDIQSSISYAGGKKLMDIRKVNYVTLGGDNAGEHLLM